LKEYAHLDARVEELYRRLDRVYAEMEAIRAGIRSRHGLKADEPWSREAEEEWNRETEELRREERELARQLERRASDLDVADPFGGPVEVYRECAGELEEAIRRMIRKWKEEREEGEHRN
jgi:protein-tyrosine phosphatase